MCVYVCRPCHARILDEDVTVLCRASSVRMAQVRSKEWTDGCAGMSVVKGGLMSWQSRPCLLGRPIGIGSPSTAQRVGASCCKDKGCRAPSGHLQSSPDNLNRSSCYFEVVTACTTVLCSLPSRLCSTIHHLDSSYIPGVPAAVRCRKLERHMQVHTKTADFLC